MKRTGLRTILILTIFLPLFVSLAGCEYLSIFQHYEYSESCDLDRGCEWYKTQMNTGTAAGNNCGPACVSMAIEYARAEEIEVSAIRSLSPTNGGWWYPRDLKDALSTYNVNFREKPLASKEQIMASLSAGHIVIVNLDMSRLTRGSPAADSRYNRYYQGVTGHFIILKGYTADQEWFQVYDPNNWQGDYYPDNTPRGKNRLYNIEEVFSSMSSWWPRFIEIS